MNAEFTPTACDKESYYITVGDYVAHNRKLYRVVRIFEDPSIEPPAGNTFLELISIKNLSILVVRDNTVEVLE
jgi:hypothetical protein